MLFPEEKKEVVSHLPAMEEAQEIIVSNHYDKDFNRLSLTEQEFERRFQMIFNKPNIDYTIEQIKNIKPSLPDNKFGNMIEENVAKLEFLVENYNFHESEDCISEIEYDLMYKYGKKCQII